MNMLKNEWIPVRLRDGRREWVRPAALARPDVVAFDADRADFNGALAQFAIGLLQMVCAPGSQAEWIVRWRKPLDEAKLHEALSPWAAHFGFDGEGVRFMQDIELRAADGDPVPIANLLIETPGENTLKNHGDHFVKRGQVGRMCPCCAALALFTLQVNAPAGGAGHRTSLRGGGPLTTLLVPSDRVDAPRSLWHLLWLNVLPMSDFPRPDDPEALEEPHFKLPWLASIAAVQSDGGSVAPVQVHPLHVLWAMPRRIRLDFDATEAGTCDLCHRPSERLVSRYVTRNYGLNYKGAWRHPLTPHYAVKDDALPMHPQPGGLGWRHWLGLVLGMDNDKRHITPAAVVSRFLGNPLLRGTDQSLRLWAFGYDMDNMKARCWYEATMPLYDLADGDAAALKWLREDITLWLDGAERVLGYARSAVKDAWFGAEARGDFSHIDAAYWSATEAMFYRMLRETLAAARSGTAIEGEALRQRWLTHLQSVALRLFEQDLVGAGPIERQNPRRVAAAHHQLRANLYGPKLRSALALPTVAAPAPRAARKTAAGAGSGARSRKPAGSTPA